MKGIILSGGTGSRLYPLTTVVNKQLIPVYDKPMIYYPMTTLIQSGIKEICIITSPDHLASYEKLFGDGKHLGLTITYRVQPAPKGVAEAFILAESFIGKDSVCLILGDNIFHGTFNRPIPEMDGTLIYAYWVKDPTAYGVVELDGLNHPISIEEKPSNPKSNYAIPGLYYFDNTVTSYAKELKPSSRGELEITDIMKRYMTLRGNKLRVEVMPRGVAWLDAGTPQTLFQSAAYIQSIQERQGLMVGCIEESCYRQNCLNKSQFKKLVEKLPKSEYRSYLENIKL